MIYFKIEFVFYRGRWIECYYCLGVVELNVEALQMWAGVVGMNYEHEG